MGPDSKRWRKVVKVTRNVEAQMAWLCYKLEIFYYKAAVRRSSVYVYGTEADKKYALNVVLYAQVEAPGLPGIHT